MGLADAGALRREGFRKLGNRLKKKYGRKTTIQIFNEAEFSEDKKRQTIISRRKHRWKDARSGSCDLRVLAAATDRQKTHSY